MARQESLPLVASGRDTLLVHASRHQSSRAEQHLEDEVSQLARSMPSPPAIDPADFARLRDLIAARPDEERWTAIPWETDLWAARRRAEDVNKPIFMWAMNGNPLGCV